MVIAVFVLKIYKSLYQFLDHVKWLDKKAKANFKICDITDWESVTIRILSNISRSSGNQAEWMWSDF